MAYQRTEYADKTMFMNSMADRKLKIQLDSIDFHRESIGKEIDREKKKIQKELADAENIMKNRLSLPDASSPNDGGKKLSPRLPRRYSTPQVCYQLRRLREIHPTLINAHQRLLGGGFLPREQRTSI